MKILNVYDASPFMYSGSAYLTNTLDCEPVRQPDGSYKASRLSVGGIAYLFKYLYATRFEECIVCFDSKPEIKLKMYPEYKANRKDRDVTQIHLQGDIAEEILRDCGYPVYRYPGYEADDLINSVWMKYGDEYDVLRIFVKDSDYYCMVDDKTEVHWVAYNGKVVTRANFATECDSSQITVFNMVTPGKVLMGDKSDNIPPLGNQVLACKIAEQLKKHEFAPFFGRKEVLEIVMDQLLTGKTREAIQERIDLVYPLFLDLDYEMGKKPQDVNRFIQWGRAMNCPNFGAFSDHAVREKLLEIFEGVGLGADNY